jgi:hypothetical protein
MSVRVNKLGGLFSSIVAGAVILSGCSGKHDAASGGADDLTATIGPEGGELVGAPGSALAGVHVVIPPGALSSATDLKVSLADDSTPLPTTAVRCGPTISIEPANLALALPATVTVPFDETVVDDSLRFDDDVKVWVRNGDKWGQQKQVDSATGEVTIELPALTHVAAGVTRVLDQDVYRFKLQPNPKFAKCLAQFPDDPSKAPTAEVTIVRGDLADALSLKVTNIKPNLAFDMFTVEHSSLKSDGTPDPAFTNFGLAWYQSDLDVDGNGHGRATLRTILLDQIFGFDPGATLAPTGTFELGFWFNDPKDAAPCGFDVTKPTPFNGEHTAGPLAMISVPDPKTNLGPLCTKPDTSTTPARCSP